MRLHKVVNRVWEGTTYYRWIVSIPPKRVRDLGWVDGQELEAVVRGSTLWIEPAIRPARPVRKSRAGLLEEGIVGRAPGRPPPSER
ncbi:MAG TPA: hypothetical protein VFF67_00540 [Thermoplasmata archaeon]|nr:hypothetical protein [Thermoplasmata archaeon]